MTPSQRFRALIRNAREATGRKVVVLVDEYDKPLLGIEENKTLFERNQSLLKRIFGNLKTMDGYIRFALLTGVARFSKVSIFSDLNNLNDISLSDRFADICGWTEDEFVGTFPEGIATTAGRLGKSFDETLATLRDYYDGYRFTSRGNRLYNPFSVMNALEHQEISPYWFATGTPSFLVRRVRNTGMEIGNLNGIWCSKDELIQGGIGAADPLPLMFQTGYLTIESYDDTRRRFLLRFPNREVELGFARSLYPLYVNARTADSIFSLDKFRDELFDGEPDNFMRRLQSLIKSLPYGQHNEANCQSIVWLLCTLSGTQTHNERHSYKGRSDLEVLTPDYNYVFEFQFNGSVREAMKQLKERDYAGQYASDPRHLFIIAANFSDRGAERGLSDWEIEKLK